MKNLPLSAVCVLQHLLLVHGTSCSKPASKWERSALFHQPLQGYKLLGHIVEILSVSSSLQCGLSCLRRSDCQSFNLRTITGTQSTCELNSGCRNSQGGSVVSLSNYQYFEKVELMEIPLSGNSPCCPNPCQNKGVCSETFDVQEYTCACQYDGNYGQNCEFWTANSSLFDAVYPDASDTKYSLFQKDVNISSFSLCLKIKMKVSSSTQTIFTLSVPEYDKGIVLTIMTTVKLLIFYVMGANIGQQTLSNLSTNQFHGICCTWSLSPNSYSFYFDGAKVADGSHSVSGPIQGQAKILLGQKLHSYSGDIDSTYPFAGEITKLNLWDEKLDHSKLTNYSQPGCGSEMGNVVLWPEFLPWMTNVVVQDPTQCQQV